MNTNIISIRNYIFIMILIIFFYYYLMNTCPCVCLDNLLNYLDIKNNFDTGDLLLLSSDDETSKIIKKGSNSVFSHCGIILKLNGKLLILECEVTAQYDYLSTKKQHKGVHLLDLDQKLRQYSGKYGSFRKLKYKNKNAILDPNNFIKIAQSTMNIKFNFNIFIWFMIYMQVPYINIFDINHTMICSQYVAYIYQKLNVLNKNTLIYYYLPKHLSENLDTINNYHFENLQYFKL